MNKTLNYARTKIKDGLSKCTPQQQEVFLRMYATKPPYEFCTTIFDIVDVMPVDKLDWAMQQVERTLEDNNA